MNSDKLQFLKTMPLARHKNLIHRRHIERMQIKFAVFQNFAADVGGK